MVKEQIKLSNCTYNISHDFSFIGERFMYVPLHWQSKFNALKIRIADWTPKHSRDNQAVFYYEVSSKDEARDILLKYKDFNFKQLEAEFEHLFYNRKHKEYSMYDAQCTGEIIDFNNKILIPYMKNKYSKL